MSKCYINSFRLIVLLIIAALLGACSSRAVPAFVGGQTKKSPDGMYIANVLNLREEVGLAVMLEDAHSDDILMSSEILLPQRSADVPLRESPSVIEWASDSRSFTVVIDDSALVTVHVP